jgi:site-specific DNA recombinase
MKRNDRQVIGYSRVSSVNQSLKTSLPYQTQKIQEYCQLNELELTDVLSEADSGGNDDREVLGCIKEMIENQIIDTLLVWKIDRLGRTMLGSLQFIELCKTNDVRVVSITDNIDTSLEQSTLMLNILLSIATEERRQIKMRCNSGREMRWKSNQVPYGKLAYGYKRNKKGSVVIDEQIKPIIQYIFKKWNLLMKMKHLTKSKRTIRLLKLLKRNGYTFYGKDFKWWNLKTILNNSFYCGLVTWKGEVKQSICEPIISKRLFNQIQTSTGS